MRFQNNIDTTMSMPHITGETMFTEPRRFIPQDEQDEDFWRDVVPGRDPVTRGRGSG